MRVGVVGDSLGVCWTAVSGVLGTTGDSNGFRLVDSIGQVAGGIDVSSKLVIRLGGLLIINNLDVLQDFFR